ncbi:alpha/beta fold hydrolase [uncultured Polaribacter sp.]|uniref:alpha/beta fold hydrolase n=1 Tax=uncultured Polaribacter sp. TaxID=174711 RepID=UPI00261EF979|nr:alpha/beta fold hydrolase [uncultured Polaribacter sp.]
MKSKIKNTERTQILNLYYQELDNLNLDFDLQTVETSFGDTNVIILENNKKPPLILVHGFFGCAPFAIQTIRGLEKHFKIYAIDILNEPNLSDAFHLNPFKKDHSKWFYEVLSRLQVYNAYFVGISLGGFIGFKTLTTNSKRIKKAFLINPTGVIKWNYFKVASHLLIPLICYKKFNNDKYLNKIYNKLYPTINDLSLKYLSKKIQTSNLSSYKFPLISEQEASLINTPLYIIASEDNFIYNGKLLINKAKKRFPSLEEVVFLKNAKYILSDKENKIVVNYILENTNFEK